MVIIGIAGSIGSGKSFTQLREALQYADDRRKQLVFNFHVDIKELYRYANMPREYDSYVSGLVYDVRYALAYFCNMYGLKTKYPKRTPRLPWISQLCRTGGIIQIPSPKYLEALLIPESVVCLDEAGILLNSREFAKTSKELLADLAQSRKDGCDLFWAAQFEEQVDKQLRLLTQYWIHCDSLSAYDKASRRPKLVWKNFIWFKAADYMQWVSNPKDRSSYVKARFAYGFKSQSGLLSQTDKQLFKVFDSFSRLDRSFSSTRIVSRNRCILPKDYYLSRLNIYCPQHDPLSRLYEPLYGYYISISPQKSAMLRIVQNSSQISKSSTRQELIAAAISLVKQRRISDAPYFKTLSDADIYNWISAKTSA